MKAKIFVVDDHPAVIEGVKAVFARSEVGEVVGWATDAKQALKEIQTLQPEIVTLDLRMPEMDGVELARRIREIAPQTKILVYTMHSFKEFMAPLLKIGIAGYVLKQDPVADLELAVQVIRNGGIYYCRDVRAVLHNAQASYPRGNGAQDPFDLLTPRELEVFKLVSNGYSMKDTARILGISINTVLTHKQHICEKLQLRSAAAWTREGVKKGIVGLN
jgi:two-component system response regulator NreC